MGKNKNIEIKDKLLFTPGPLTTSLSVKEAALCDLGSRDFQFISVVSQIRNKLLSLAHAGNEHFEAIIMQGSGTFGIESVISTVIPLNGKLLNIINGAYGRRISQIANIHSIPLKELEYHENIIPSIDDIEYELSNDPDITHVSVIHCETTTGIMNPIMDIGKVVKKFNKTFIVDAMSSFGGYDIDINSASISYLISSSNKCIEGIPGFSFILADKKNLEKCKNQARTLTLDLYDQCLSMNSNGQFRFTPPVQVLLAFKQALDELEEEGGIEKRSARYVENNNLLVKGMRELGFKTYLNDELRGYVITSFLYPDNPGFSFSDFYNSLNEQGFVIYPGKLTKTDCFRIGNIGRLFPSDILKLLDGVKKTLLEMNIVLN